MKRHQNKERADEETRDHLWRVEEAQLPRHDLTIATAVAAAVMQFQNGAPTLMLA